MRLHPAIQAMPQKLLQRLRQQLNRRVRLKRQGLSLHVVLDPVAPPVRRDTTRRPSPRERGRQQMRQELAQALDRHPCARQLFPALTLVERALARRDGDLQRLPERAVADALRLLDQLVGDWTGEGLVRLRAELASLAPAAEDAGSPSFEVQEATLSAFMEIDGEWQRRAASPASA